MTTHSATVQPDKGVSPQYANIDAVWDIPSKNSRFADQLKEISGVDLNVCYQCRKCYSGCPVAYAMDYSPVQLLHAARLGLIDLVLNSATIWLCAACETCVTRCPQDIDMVKLMDAMRRQAIDGKYKIAVPEVASFFKVSLLNIRMFGRMYEVGLIAHLKLATLNFTRDLRLGLELLKKRKLALLPNFKSIGRANRLFSRAAKLEQSK
jgi:heterodisulfide reductase subunit C